jgi:hypothetical protein
VVASQSTAGSGLKAPNGVRARPLTRDISRSVSRLLWSERRSLSGFVASAAYTWSFDSVDTPTQVLAASLGRHSCDLLALGGGSSGGRDAGSVQLSQGAEPQPAASIHGVRQADGRVPAGERRRLGDEREGGELTSPSRLLQRVRWRDVGDTQAAHRSLTPRPHR